MHIINLHIIANRLATLFFALSLLLFMGSCKAIKQNKLFESEGEINSEIFEQKLNALNKGYVIKKFDVLAISVFPNNGEQIIDQTGDYPSSGGGSNINLQQQQQQNRNGGLGGNNVLSGQEIAFNNARPTFYSVNEAGMLNLPIIGQTYAEGLTLLELDSALTQSYAAYVKEPYILSEFINKRVVVMGALGDQIIPIQNGGITLLELLTKASGARSGGGTNVGAGIGSLQRNAKADQIKIIRGTPGNISVMIADLTTVEGLNKAQVTVQPNDIIYIPPRRRLDRETLGDVSAILSPILSTIGFITTILVLINR